MERTPLKLAIICVTFSLSSKKPSHAPPRLIHRVRVPVNTRSSLQPAKLPFTVTWGDNQIYISYSSKLLRVYRIELFSSKPSRKATSNIGDVLRPKKTMFLPELAERGLVYYSPPTAGDRLGKIIVSDGRQLKSSKQELSPASEDDLDTIMFDGPATIFESCTELRPVVRCYVHEQDDLGDWEVYADDIGNVAETSDWGTLSR